MTSVIFEEKYYPAVKETVYQTRLSNGLIVSLLPKKQFNEVYGVVTVRFGSVDTSFTLSKKGLQCYPAGIAHFLEHKLFERENAEDIMESFTRLGADSNAFTSFTKTSYLFSTIDHLSENLDLLEELVTVAHFTKESVEREREIIQQEREMYKDDPDSRLFFATLANLYPDTPLATDIVGSEKSISEIQVSNLKENFTDFYKPVNMSLFLVGNIDVDVVLEYFSKKENKILEQFTVSKEQLPLQPVKQTDSLRMEVSLPKLAVAIRGTGQITEEESYRYNILLKLLFTMMFGWTSDRFQRLYETGKLDASLSLEVEVNSRFHFVILTMDTKEPVSLSHQFRKAIRHFSSDTDLTEEHLDLVKSEMFGELFSSMNSLEFIANQYDPMDRGETIFDFPKILQEITLEDVLEAGHRLIDNGDLVDFTIFPA
ncbi:EF-P 5-aminopentanol modification-associated protein YfmH [Streptococcus oralis]|uniref:EF-P 5-aminopentanol modification-associated protein YfmH n=1 Tax=Streptococcus oralis TaxID=1303 RepID=UPI00189AC7A3|nr:pitrilysin family protein [Streptococcus oralis]